MSEIRANKIGNAAGTEAIDVTNVAGSNGITVNANGLISSGPQSGGGTSFATTLKVGPFADNTYTTITNNLNHTNTSLCKAWYSLINPRLIWLSFYVYSPSHIGTWTAGNGWGVEIGIPNVKFVGGDGAAYQFLNVGYHAMNGTYYHNANHHRWQANTGGGGVGEHNKLAMYGPQWNTTWSSGSAEFHGSGFLLLSDAITS